MSPMSGRDPAAPVPATLCLLTLNEITGVRRLCDAIPFAAFDEAFVLDGGSTDGTVEYLTARGIRVIPQARRGKGTAFCDAVRLARGERVVFFAPDGNEDPRDILPLLHKRREGYDLAVASRFLPGAADEDAGKWFPLRRWGNLGFTWIANRLWNRGPYVTDTINGFLAITKTAFARLQPTALGFNIEFQIAIRAMKLGLRVAELPSREGPRLGGRSKAGTLRTGWDLCRTLWQEWRAGAP